MTLQKMINLSELLGLPQNASWGQRGLTVSSPLCPAGLKQSLAHSGNLEQYLLVNWLADSCDPSESYVKDLEVYLWNCLIC